VSAADEDRVRVLYHELRAAMAAGRTGVALVIAGEALALGRYLAARGGSDEIIVLICWIEDDVTAMRKREKAA